MLFVRMVNVLFGWMLLFCWMLFGWILFDWILQCIGNVIVGTTVHNLALYKCEIVRALFRILHFVSARFCRALSIFW